MFRAIRKRRWSRETRTWKWWRRKYAREHFCKKCERPFLETPLPKEVEQIVSGSAAAFIYPTRSWARREFVVRFGRWQSHPRGLWLSELFTQNDLPDLVQVAAQAQSFIDEMLGQKTRAGTRR